MKKFFLIFVFLTTLCLSVHSQAVEPYNSIATAYVTTTIQQNVVFDNNMKAGGTFNFSVLAHNGGGRAGQSDTANVKIQFFTAGGTLVTQANTTYSANLPNPNAVCGNPCIDTSVPWSTLSISSTLTAAQAGTVKYATVSMYGIDGSYWAGDYGPWYRAPTFTLNGGTNLAYNPEFGPYNNIAAQGWTLSPALGACQGAWGGSNPCIANSSGQPGVSTTGLVANQNGGGPSSTGGTTSGQAGGYNSTMTTSAPTGAPPPTTAPAKPTFTQLKFGAAQVADTQWNVQACTQTNSCQIYSKQSGVTWNNGSPTYLSAGQYIGFVANTGSDSATNPWTMILYNSNGTVAQNLGTGRILVQGTDTAGNGYFFFTNDNYNGSFFSLNQGWNNTSGVTFTGTASPSVSQTDTFAGSGSTAVLASGTSGGTTAAPTLCCGGSSASFSASATNITKVAAFNARTTQDNQVYITQIGNQNTITVNQSGTRNNYFKYNGNGANNAITSTQTGTAATQANYVDLTVNGSSNTVNILQQSTGGAKGAFVNIQDSNNSLKLQQKDSGSHYAEVNLSGGNKNVDILQQGSANHMAKVALTGLATDFSLTQTGSTQNFYSINFNCATVGGCAKITVQQGQ